MISITIVCVDLVKKLIIDRSEATLLNDSTTLMALKLGVNTSDMLIGDIMNSLIVMIILKNK